MTEPISKDGAQKMAADIRAYWRKIGFWGIDTWIEAILAPGHGTIYVVRSNIGPSGFPPELPKV